MNKAPSPIGISHILRIAIPAIIAGIAEPLISLTDVAVVGNMKNGAVNGLLAVGLVGSFLSAIIWTLAQTKTSLSSIISKCLGAGNLSSISGLVPQAIALNVVLGLFIYTITAPLASWIFTFYQASDEVLILSADYYQIRAIGFPITLAAFALFGVFRGLQNTSWAMIASLAGAFVNLFLDIILVYGWSDYVPAFGLIGAAYASLCAQSVMLLIAIFFFLKKTPFTFRLTEMQFHPVLKDHLGLTANFFFRTLAINLAIFLSYRFAASYGTHQGAAHAVLMNIWLFFSFFIDGFANAGNAIGGKLMGARDRNGLRYLGRMTTIYGVLVAVILVIVCAVLYDWIAVQFTENSSVQNSFIKVFWIVLLMQPINAVAFVFDGIFKGWGAASYLRNVLFIVTLGVFIPVIYLLDYFEWELQAVWSAFFCWMVSRAVVLIIAFYKRLEEF